MRDRKNGQTCTSEKWHWRAEKTRLPAIGKRGGEVDLRCHAPGQLRQRPAIRPRADLDSLPAHPRRARNARGGRSGKPLGLPFQPSLSAPYRWRDWAAPDSARRQDKRPEASVWKFVHDELLLTLRNLKAQQGATVRQKVISEIMSSVERSRIDSEKNFLDVLDKVHALSHDSVDDTHVFALSQVYEGLLLKMGEKGNDGGQFFTPREIIRVMVRTVDPKIGRTVYDPGCGTGGFLAQTFEYLRAQGGLTPSTASSWKRCATAPSTAGKRTTPSTRSRWPISSCTASMSRTSGMATRSRTRRPTASSIAAHRSSSTTS